ncbi:MAG: c-type cytochrome [Alphaproteobacteria bacterium]
MKRAGVLILTACALFSASAWAQSAAPPAAGDAAAGKSYFGKVCAMCHSDAPSPVAPSLTGVFGRKAGTATGPYKYSPAMITSGITWDAPKLDTYLAGPTAMIKGSRMPISVAKPADRANLIAYLKTLK